MRGVLPHQLRFRTGRDGIGQGAVCGSLTVGNFGRCKCFHDVAPCLVRVDGCSMRSTGVLLNRVSGVRFGLVWRYIHHTYPAERHNLDPVREPRSQSLQTIYGQSRSHLAIFASVSIRTVKRHGTHRVTRSGRTSIWAWVLARSLISCARSPTLSLSFSLLRTLRERGNWQVVAELRHLSSRLMGR